MNHNFQVVPCGPDYPVDSSAYNPCQSSYSSEAYDSYPVGYASFGPSASNSDAANYAVGGYLYMSVVRYSNTYDDQACPYTIYTNVTGNTFYLKKILTFKLALLTKLESMTESLETLYANQSLF